MLTAKHYLLFAFLYVTKGAGRRPEYAGGISAVI